MAETEPGLLCAHRSPFVTGTCGKPADPETAEWETPMCTPHLTALKGLFGLGLGKVRMRAEPDAVEEVVRHRRR